MGARQQVFQCGISTVQGRIFAGFALLLVAVAFVQVRQRVQTVNAFVLVFEPLQRHQGRQGQRPAHAFGIHSQQHIKLLAGRFLPHGLDAHDRVAPHQHAMQWQTHGRSGQAGQPRPDQFVGQCPCLVPGVDAGNFGRSHVHPGGLQPIPLHTLAQTCQRILQTHSGVQVVNQGTPGQLGPLGALLQAAHQQGLQLLCQAPGFVLAHSRHGQVARQAASAHRSAGKRCRAWSMRSYTSRPLRLNNSSS